MKKINRSFSVRRLFAIGAALGGASAGNSYDIQDQISYWPVGDVEWNFNLVSAPPNIPNVSGGSPLMDGSTSWDDAVGVAIDAYNALIPDNVLTLTANKNSGVTAGENDGINNVSFSGTVYGDAWGGSTLGISISRWSGSRRMENDVLFNSNKTWNAYTGNLQGGTNDIRRVAIHEFGHSLGLDHPDQDGQNVSAVMNSTTSNLDALTSDDIAGAISLYGAIMPLEIIWQPQSVSVVEGSNAPLAVGVRGSEEITFQWQYSSNGGSSWSDLTGFTGNPLFLVNAQAGYNGWLARVQVTDYSGGTTLTSEAMTLTVTPNPVALAVSAQPQNAAVNVGEDASFFFDVTGSPSPTYQWEYSDDNGSTWSTMVEGNIGTGTSIATLTIPDASTDFDGYQFRCTATQEGTPATVETSNAASLTVDDPSVPIYILGKSRSFIQTSAAAPVLRAAITEPWELNVQVLGLDDTDFDGITVTPPGGGSATALEWNANDGQWNLPGDPSYMTQAELDADLPDSASPVVFSFDPAGGGSIVQSSLVLNGDAYTPAPFIQNFSTTQGLDSTASYNLAWNAVTGATANDFVLVFIEDNNGDSVFTTPLPGAAGALPGNTTSLLIPADTFVGGGPYRVQVIVIKVVDSKTGDVAGANGYALYATSTEFEVVTAGSPAFTTQPASQGVDQGQTATFTVAVTGTPTPALQWRKDGVAIPGANGTSLNLTNAQPGDAAAYDVVATNTQGTSTSNAATLTVNVIDPPPQPAPPNSSSPYAGGFTVEWPGIAGATGYLLDIATDNGFTNFVSGFQALDVGNVSSFDVTGLQPGSYFYRISAYNGAGTSSPSSASALIVQASRFASLSTRGQTADQGGVLILGFVISGTQPKNLMIRAAGPALGNLGVPGTVADPRLVLFDSGAAVIPPGNDDWDDSDTALVDAVNQVSAFPFGSGSKDAAMLVTLNPGLYSVHAQTVTTASGITLVELYELDETSSFSSISTRAFVGTGNLAIIPGVNIFGGTNRVMVRAVGGQTLAGFGIPFDEVLADPVVSIVRFEDSVVLGTNDDWGSDGNAAEITAAADSVSAFPLPSGSTDAVAFVDLPQGLFTFVVSGKNGGTGIVLLEVYKIP